MNQLELPPSDRRPRQEERASNQLLTRNQARTRIVCLGGGTGLPVVLRGLGRRARPREGDPGLDLTAVVAMSDDGGSSGRLRRTRGLLPPGDIRNCLVALAFGHPALKEIFQFRFGGSKGIAGHAVGNLLIAALAELRGDFLEAVRVSGRLLGARGTVLPSTLEPVQLVAELADETRLVGERKIACAHKQVRRISLRPRRPPPSQGVLEAIAQAELITIGPGSLYSSVMPNLLVDGVAEALQRSRALKVLVANLMTQPGETDGMSAADHVRAVVQHVGHVVDVVLINRELPSDDAAERYADQGAQAVAYDRQALLDLGVVPLEVDLLRPGKKIRHDAGKLARVLLKLARTGL
jgi:uncharacterized cofD-like protein